MELPIADRERFIETFANLQLCIGRCARALADIRAHRFADEPGPQPSDQQHDPASVLDHWNPTHAHEGAQNLRELATLHTKFAEALIAHATALDKTATEAEVIIKALRAQEPVK